MQATTLLENSNSELLAAFSSLLPRNAAQRVIVYVEGNEDISFWRNILDSLNTKNVDFDIQLPVKNALEKGKTAALEKSEAWLNIGIGTHMIVCVDSDYDYLLQDKTAVSRKINQSEFIFQTYTYSIENLLCFSPSLRALCTQATKYDLKIIEIEDLLAIYSKIIYKLFLWSVHFRIKEDFTTFNISDFSDCIKILEKAKIEDNFVTALQGLDDKVKAKITELENRFPEDIAQIEALSQELKTLGLEENNTYLFAQGHTIKDNVVLMFLKPICEYLKVEKINQINLSAKHKTQNIDEINQYRKQRIDIETVLNSNTEYKSCFLFLKLQEDLSGYLGKFEGL